MRKSHYNEQFLVLFGPIISRFFACLKEGKKTPKQQSVCALVLSLWYFHENKNIPVLVDFSLPVQELFKLFEGFLSFWKFETFVSLFRILEVLQMFVSKDFDSLLIF
jgi:hypothetical protein